MLKSAALSVVGRRYGRLLMFVLLCAVAGLAQAQTASTDADDSADPPTRVARLSYTAGDLGFLPAGAKDWSDANINRPLTTGDRLSTGQGARAELEFGGGTLRMNGQSDLGLLDLNDQLAQIELTQGALSVTVQRLEEGQSYEIDTPTVALVIDQPGTFRVDVSDTDGDTLITAFAGDATVYGDNNAQRTINAGRSYRFADSGLAVVTISEIGGGDGFDAWANERDQRYVQSGSSQYVSEDVVGYQDLDQFGDWQDTGEYGAVWFPNRVSADWAPYRDGHWAYIGPWGWTWVDDSPWGFAPYHYGRWAYVRGGWGWIPGPRGVRPIYAPALVAFVGGGGWSVGIGGSPVGWFPLGPGEIYNPWYRCGRGCYTAVNMHNLRGPRGYDPRRDIDNHYSRYRSGQPGRGDHYANRTAPRGFTAVPGQTFAGGRHVQRDLVRIDPRKLTDAPVLARGAERLRPVGNAMTTPRSAHVRNLPAGGFNREVVARRAPQAIAQDTRGPGRNALAATPALAAPRSNVRVLNARGNPDRMTRPLPAVDGRMSEGSTRRPSNAPAQLPAVPRITAAAPAAAPQGNPSAMREDGALPSARFVRGRDREPAAQRAMQPRPGVSYISGNRSDPAQPAAATLPQVPQIERADPRPRQTDGTRFQRPERTVAPETSSMPARARPESRFQRQEPPPREYVREQPRPTPSPSRNEPPPSRYQPTQRAQPQQPRAETPRPQRSESRPSNRKPPAREDGSQH